MTSSDSKYSSTDQLSYRDAGVNIDAGNLLVERINPLQNVPGGQKLLGELGDLELFLKFRKKYRQPVLVSGTDGVGTKLKLAFHFNRHDRIGIDLVAMSVNDILVQGAEPLFFLDYFACGKLNIDMAAQVIEGIAVGCEQSGCALIGGETAEMPGMYPEGEYDLAGFAVGVVEKDQIIDGTSIAENDVILGMASSGAHSNGFSLIRKILERYPVDPDLKLVDKVKLLDAIMEPTRIYVKAILELKKHIPIKGLAHITGGGLLENIPRILPTNLKAALHKDSWTVPPLFKWLQAHGNVADEEMYRVFNCGIGMIIVVAPEHVDETLAALTTYNETAWKIGTVQPNHTNDQRVLIV